jgi:hypothetical protein
LSITQPRQGFVIAQLALRQADDGLQIKIHAVLFQAGAHDLEQFVLVAEGADIGRRRAALRTRRLVRHGARASGNLAGEIAHQGFQHFQLGDDLLFLGAGLLLHLSAQLGEAVAGLVQRAFEFQVALAQMRHLTRDGALVAAPGEGGHDLLDEDKADQARQDRDRPAGEEGKARAQGGADEEHAEGQQESGDAGDVFAHAPIMGAGRFQFLNRENPAPPQKYGLRRSKFRRALVHTRVPKKRRPRLSGAFRFHSLY